ncbi:methyltransferase domain-containing protein [Solwaraspora sp. WMMD791]|uniref:SAM-dependent methyltransferase n=1 Tax=Solwaraspora sp. WMMD791 TaxID=3016086 RepID=UPI002499BF46|nr:methyltransferase domain-containing protein [Solwaraspora sp. WMMD791]WFE29253.1 methyltransferase domain-containing protein [Solwaraspora sp. WMMD791]
MNADVGRHFDERSPIEDEFRDGHLHMWYWYDRDDPATLTEAVLRITQKVTDTLGLRRGEHLMDAGCGPGGTAVYLATTHDVRITGITLSEFELHRATTRARRAGVDDRVRFQLADFMALPYRTGSFDAVLALESLQNAPDLDLALRELFRVLRPGGRISFSDFTLESSAEPDRLSAFMAALNLPRVPTLAEWLAHTRAAGFDIEEYTQCGPRVVGRQSSYIVAASRRREEIGARFGDGVLAEFSKGQRGFFAPRQNQVGYAIVSARKPYR